MSLPQIPAIPNVQPGQPWTSALFNGTVGQGLSFLLAPPLAVLQQSATQGIANVTVTAVGWDNESVDTYGGHSNTTNNSRYTVQVAGWYLVIVSLDWSTNVNGFRQSYVYKNGSPVVGAYQAWNASGSSTGEQVQVLVQCNAGDYIEAYCYQNSGGSLTLGAAQTQMQVIWEHM